MLPSQKINNIVEEKYILSIEAAVGGGSLSLLINEQEIGSWIGTREISRAEDVLDEISNLLKKNIIKKEQINSIVVSKGVGSLTGEKIGQAIAKGLAKSINRRLIERFVLESLLTEIDDRPEGEYLTAIPVGKNRVCWQIYNAENGTFNAGTPNYQYQISDEHTFTEALNVCTYRKAVLASGLYEFYNREVQTEIKHKIFVTPRSLAEVNGRAALFASDNE